MECAPKVRFATDSALENSGRIGGFEKGEFERDSARKEAAAQVCVRWADPVQLRAQEIGAIASSRFRYAIFNRRSGANPRGDEVGGGVVIRRAPEPLGTKQALGG
jgi:hypothetical protein